MVDEYKRVRKRIGEVAREARAASEGRGGEVRKQEGGRGAGWG